VKDELKGLFDDRKMAVRQEQRSMETKVRFKTLEPPFFAMLVGRESGVANVDVGWQIQELNYQITIKLNSDARSEVEGLRWVLTRRIAMGIATMATMVIILLQLNSSRKHEQKEEKKKAGEAGKNNGGDGSNEPRTMGMSNITAVSTPGMEQALGSELLATEGVSLG
jgi:hypothetical protein